MSTVKKTYLLTVRIPAVLKLSNGAEQTRDDFLGRCAQMVEPEQFLGVTEGVLLAEEAHERGYETESWVLDAGLAPHERDWVQQEKENPVDFYFSSEEAAHSLLKWMRSEWPKLSELEKNGHVFLSEVPEQDWNAQWKASFQGIEVEPGMKVLPPWVERGPKDIIINPGAGFGTGTHETTQLCLKTLKRLGDLSGKTALDFGSGSGILSIAAALWGAKVVGVEIDPLAIENAQENAKLNHVTNQIEWRMDLPECNDEHPQQFDILLANILRPILIQYAPEIKKRLKPDSVLVLSGLVAQDVPLILDYYAGYRAEVFEKGDWRAILMRSQSSKK